MRTARKPRFLLLVAGLAASATALVLAAGGTDYATGPHTVDKGGDRTSLGDHRLLGTVGDTAVGITGNALYRLNAGLIPALDFQGIWLEGVGLPSPAVIGPTGTSAFDWAASRDGTYELRVDGQTLDSGSFVGGRVVTTEILASELPPDAWSEVILEVTSGPDSSGLTYRVYHDATPPDLSDFTLTQIVGRVSPDRASGPANEVVAVVPGQPDTAVPVAPDGSFVHDLPPGTSVVHYDLPNLLGRPTRRTVDLSGEAPPPPEESSVGKTVFWPREEGEGEAEIEYDISTHDAKGRLFGTAVLRLPGDPNTYLLGQVKGKLRFNKRTQVHKLSLRMKSLKGQEPKCTVKFGRAFFQSGVVHAGRVKVKVKNLLSAKFVDVAYRPLEDNGSPVEIELVRVAGTAEDGREGSRVEVTSSDGTFEEVTPVPFTETLREESDYASTLLAEDDAAPPNQRTRVLRAVVGRIE